MDRIWAKVANAVPQTDCSLSLLFEMKACLRFGKFKDPFVGNNKLRKQGRRLANVIRAKRTV